MELYKFSKVCMNRFFYFIQVNTERILWTEHSTLSLFLRGSIISGTHQNAHRIQMEILTNRASIILLPPLYLPGVIFHFILVIVAVVRFLN